MYWYSVTVRGEEAITLFHSIAVNTKKYDQVFHDELGSMKDITVKQHVKPDSKPVFLNARPVPYALRPKVEADLDAMVATPIVPVPKKTVESRSVGT